MTGTVLSIIELLLDYVLKGLSYFGAYQAGKKATRTEAKLEEDKVVIDLLKSDSDLARLPKNSYQKVVDKVRARFP